VPRDLIATVGRKTPRDGRIEIDAAAALPFLGSAATPEVTLDGQHVDGAVERMPCTCDKGGAGHAHYFLRSPAFAALPPGATLRVTLDPGAAAIAVARA
jgi:hypothetical protein